MKLSERYNNKLNVAGSGYDNILVQMELTNACNHRCVFCPNHSSNRKRTMMDMHFAKRIIDEADAFLGENRQICFHMNGEPLLYKGIEELIAYSKNKNFDYVFLTTNGTVGDNDLLSRIYDAGLDSIKFSINAGSAETYLNIHGYDGFERAIEALKYSSNYRDKNRKDLKLFVSCVGFKDNKDELLSLQERVSSYCDEVVFYYPCGYAGSNNSLARELRCDLSDLDIKAMEIKHNAPCAVLWNSINVTCEGYLSLCCSESDNRLIVEDLHNQNLKEAWESEKMQKIRELHMKGDVKGMPCWSCIYEDVFNENDIDKDLFSLAIEKRR